MALQSYSDKSVQFECVRLKQGVWEEDVQEVATCISKASKKDIDLALFTSITLGNAELVDIIIKAGANPNIQDGEGRSPLYQAVRYAHFEISTYLIDHNADPNVSKTNNSNALHYSSKRGLLEFVQLLVEAGCCVNSTNWGGNTALLIACRFGHLEVVRYLLENGASFDINNKLGHYPVHYGALYDDGSVVQTLLDFGARADPPTFCGVTPIMLACERKNCAVVSILAPMSDLNSHEKLCGRTVLHWAVNCGCLHCVSTIINNGASLNVTDSSGRTPLIQAVISNKPGVIALLLQNITSQTSGLCLHDQCVLHVAASSSNENCVAVLLSSLFCQELLYFKDYFGDTPMKLALDAGNVSVAVSFLYAGWDFEKDKTVVTKENDSDGLYKLMSQFSNKDTYKLLAVARRLVQHTKLNHGSVAGGISKPLFKTYSPIKMGMINLLKSASHDQMLAPENFNFHTWLDEGPEAFNLRVMGKEFTDWLRMILHSPFSLREICRGHLRKTLGYRASDKVDTLTLPDPIKNFLKMTELENLKDGDIRIKNSRSHALADIE